jgi:hypothetical protein
LNIKLIETCFSLQQGKQEQSESTKTQKTSQ